MERIEQHACYGGRQEVWKHASDTLACDMRVGVYLPPQAERAACPVLYWLSGLTCTEQNFITKAGAQRYAAEHGVIVVAPDTSPRGEGVPDADGYDIGLGAGFYVNATQAPWSMHYRMYDYVTQELPSLIETFFPTTQARAISGHSMGGHGALVAALRNPGRYRSVSAFAPIVAPTQVPWGQKAFAQLPGRRPRSMEGMGRGGTGARCGRAPAAAHRPGRRRRLSRHATATGVAAQGVRRRRPSAVAEDAHRLRPQLLLHRQFHRRAHRASRDGVAGLIRCRRQNRDSVRVHAGT